MAKDRREDKLRDVIVYLQNINIVLRPKELSNCLYLRDLHPGHHDTYNPGQNCLQLEVVYYFASLAFSVIHLQKGPQEILSVIP
jgi:hypothetical protein